VRSIRTANHCPHLQRHIHDIVAYLSGDEQRPGYDEEIADVFRRRQPVYTACCSCDFVIREGDTDWEKINVRRFFKRRSATNFVLPIQHDLQRLAHLIADGSPGDFVPARDFYLFGSPIAHSPSPQMHNSMFKECCLPGVYTKLDTTEIDAVCKAMRHGRFGGASVTIPHKEAIMPHMDKLTAVAEAIGM
jgi:hypothetical protein